MSKKQKNKNKIKKSKQNKRINKESTSYQIESRKIIIVLITVLIIFGGMYLLTMLILHKSDTPDYSSEKTSIQYEEILLGTVFHKKDSEYLVLFYDTSYDTDNVYSGLISDYQAKDEKLPIYYVDLSKAMNKNCLSSESNSKATSAEELKINDTTLVKISSKKITDYIVGQEDITNYLNK